MNHARWMYLAFFVLGGFLFAPLKATLLGFTGRPAVVAG